MKWIVRVVVLAVVVAAATAAVAILLDLQDWVTYELVPGLIILVFVALWARADGRAAAHRRMARRAALREGVEPPSGTTQIQTPRT
jgi:hypothetical protein